MVLLEVTSTLEDHGNRGNDQHQGESAAEPEVFAADGLGQGAKTLEFAWGGASCYQWETVRSAVAMRGHADRKQHVLEMLGVHAWPPWVNRSIGGLGVDEHPKKVVGTGLDRWASMCWVRPVCS